jgi:hypothetical protein
LRWKSGYTMQVRTTEVIITTLPFVHRNCYRIKLHLYGIAQIAGRRRIEGHHKLPTTLFYSRKNSSPLHTGSRVVGAGRGRGRGLLPRRQLDSGAVASNGTARAPGEGRTTARAPVERRTARRRGWEGREERSRRRSWEGNRRSAAGVGRTRWGGGGSPGARAAPVARREGPIQISRRGASGVEMGMRTCAPASSTNE